MNVENFAVRSDHPVLQAEINATDIITNQTD